MSVEDDSIPEVQKWKYCILNITLDRKKKEITTLFFLNVDIDKIQKEEIKDKNPFQIIAEMGEKGWEMVGGSDNQGMIFFKTPIK